MPRGLSIVVVSRAFWCGPPESRKGRVTAVSSASSVRAVSRSQMMATQSGKHLRGTGAPAFGWIAGPRRPRECPKEVAASRAGLVRMQCARGVGSGANIPANGPFGAAPAEALLTIIPGLTPLLPAGSTLGA